MDDRKYCVYRHTAPNGKVYIGVTSLTPERRWGNGHGYKRHAHFWNAIVKYGWDNILHEIVCDELNKEQAYSLEKELIAAYCSTDPRFGYNASVGGCGGACGVQISGETRKKRSAARTALLSDPKRRVAASETQKAVWADPVKRQKIMDGMRSGGQKRRRLQVEQHLLNGGYVKTWSSMCEIERELGIPTGKISECCNGKRASYKGFYWTFSEVGQ